ncbi:hypothetical protein J2Z83_002621 [Virgibacillus natechei]|uniref:Uncharacterized protein n=1 Tax=Virgibacillus natechei TaxID=1216297 RepID=A0ABS4IHV1_9BACI|nr:hypothetical protein [Virgibacillus natechei]MBP1970500.1 hypothetical protein [Virgibacillus natechei]UZD14095.1 hypothetical protein OLD84_06135 [Virgibacillus natechei]
MSRYMKEIQIYEEDIFDFEVSPFEMHHGLFLRSELEKHWEKMDSNEQLQLLSADLKVIKNADKIVNHLREIYDFSSSNKPESEWWWHLDKVSN